MHDPTSAAELDQSFREYARDAASSQQWIFINLPLNHAFTCPQLMTHDELQTRLVPLFAMTKRFLNGEYTNGRSLWSRVALIQIADEPDIHCTGAWQTRVANLVDQAHEQFPGIKVMVNYVFNTAVGVPKALDVVGVDPYFMPAPGGGGPRDFDNQVNPNVENAKRSGKPVVIIARSFANAVNTRSHTVCSQYDRLLTPTQESYYIALAQRDPQILGLMWGWLFQDFYVGACRVAYSGVIHDPSIRAFHQQAGQQIRNAAPAPPLP